MPGDDGIGKFPTAAYWSLLRRWARPASPSSGASSWRTPSGKREIGIRTANREMEQSPPSLSWTWMSLNCFFGATHSSTWHWVFSERPAEEHHFRLSAAVRQYPGAPVPLLEPLGWARGVVGPPTRASRQHRGALPTRWSDTSRRYSARLVGDSLW